MTAQNQKITVLVPLEIKNALDQLKNDLQASLNSIYVMAISEFLEKKKREKLRMQAAQMVEEYKTNPEMIEWQEFEGDRSES